MPVDSVDLFIFNPDMIWLNVRPFHNTGLIGFIFNRADIKNYIYLAIQKYIDALFYQFFYTFVIYFESLSFRLLWNYA